MKIKLSRSQWELVGKKAGWMKTAQDSFDHKNPKNYAPGQTPYTDEEWNKVRKMVGDAAAGDPGEQNEPDVYKAMRPVKITFNNGDHLTTQINGTKDEILKYYMPDGKRGADQDYSDAEPNALRHVVKVEFLD